MNVLRIAATVGWVASLLAGCIAPRSEAPTQVQGTNTCPASIQVASPTRGVTTEWKCSLTPVGRCSCTDQQR